MCCDRVTVLCASVPSMEWWASASITAHGSKCGMRWRVYGSREDIDEEGARRSGGWRMQMWAL